ncbi:MAG: hypothetical protein K2P51_01985 [Rhabdochlamydiaceae bacterium]|nr:hypothetical protein [Rhabdochlamydiaceae bacterium]
MAVDPVHFTLEPSDRSVLDNSFESFRNQSASGYLFVQVVEDRSLRSVFFRDGSHERLRINWECSIAIRNSHNIFLNGLFHMRPRSWCQLHDELRRSICWVNVDSLVDKTDLSHAEARRLIRQPSGLAAFIKSVDRHVHERVSDVKETDLKIPLGPKAYSFLRDRCPQLLNCFAHEDHAQEIRDALRFVKAEGRPFLLHRKRYPFLPRSVLITSDKQLIVLFNRTSKGDRRASVDGRGRTDWLGYNVTAGKEVLYVSQRSGCDQGDDCVRHFDRSLSNASAVMEGMVPGSFLMKKTPEKPEGRYISISERVEKSLSFVPDEDMDESIGC